jgi:hypothetical protein
MPYSHYELIPIIISEVKRIQPVSILDVGCGLGVYGLLCRIYLDLYDDAEFFEKLKKEDGSKDWTVTIDGIEGFREYLRFIPRWAYDDLIVGDAIEVLSSKEDGEYDLVLALAILEHLGKEDGFRFLGELKRVGKRVIVSTPKEVKEQVVPDNPYETHRSHWTDTEFRKMGFNRFIPHWGTWIAINEDVKETEADTGIDSVDGVRSDIRDIKESILSISDALKTSLNMQTLILDRLSLSVRFKAFFKRLKELFKS